MANDAEPSVVVRNRAVTRTYALGYAAFALLWLAVPAPAESPPVGRAVVIALALVSAVLAVRAGRAALVVSATEVRVRNILWTSVIPWRELTIVRVGYGPPLTKTSFGIWLIGPNENKPAACTATNSREKAKRFQAMVLDASPEWVHAHLTSDQSPEHR